MLPHHWAWLFVLETLAIVGYLVAVIAYVKPPALVIVASALGIAPLVAYQVACDPLVARRDLFRFEDHASRQAWLMYPQTLLAFTMVGILGWYLWRRFGPNVLVVFTLIGLLMPLRDLAFAHTTHWIDFGPGVAPWVIDALGNAFAMVVPVLAAYAVTRPRWSATSAP